MAAILSRHRLSYIYGSVAADVVFAKRLSRVKQACHHWSTGLALLQAAKDDRGRAFAYGYLSHLAADTVAHNKYVPHQILVSGSSVNFGHTYWEVRADAAADEGACRLLRNVIDLDHDQHHTELRNHLSGTFLTYGLNRVVFHRITALAMDVSLRRTIGLWSRYSRWDVPEGLLSRYHDECVDRIMSVLSLDRESAVLREDPNGTSALMQLRVRRRERRRLNRRGLHTAHHIREATLALAPSWPVSLGTLASPKPGGKALLLSGHMEVPKVELPPAAQPKEQEGSGSAVA